MYCSSTALLSWEKMNTPGWLFKNIEAPAKSSARAGESGTTMTGLNYVENHKDRRMVLRDICFDPVSYNYEIYYYKDMQEADRT